MRYLVLLFILCAAPAFAQTGFRPHDCLGASVTNTVTVTSGATATGAEVLPLGDSSEMSGFLVFGGSGKLTVTVQTRRARGSWCTPTVGAEPITAVAAGSYSFSISIPPCDSLRLLYTATVADAGVTDAFVLEK